MDSESDAAGADESGLSFDSAKDFLAKTGHKAAGIKTPDLGGLILDAGCGNGRFSREASKFAKRVISVDASEAAHVAFRNMRAHAIDNVGVVRGSAIDLPIADGSLSYAFTIGVLQHTGNAPRMLAEMARCIQDGAKMSVNCYGTGTATYEWVDAAIRRRTTGVSQERKLAIARRLAGFNRGLRRMGWLGARIESRLRSVITLRPTDVQMYDWYAPKIAEPYTPDDLNGMFRDTGLDIVAARYPIHEPDYDDRKRQRRASAYSFLLRKTD